MVSIHLYARQCSSTDGRFPFLSSAHLYRDEDYIPRLQRAFDVANLPSIMDDFPHISAVTLLAHHATDQMPQRIAVSSSNLDHIAVNRAGLIICSPYEAGCHQDK